MFRYRCLLGEVRSAMTDVECVHIWFGFGLCMSEFSKKKWTKWAVPTLFVLILAYANEVIVLAWKVMRRIVGGKELGMICAVIILFLLKQNLFVPLLTLWHKRSDTVYVVQTLLNRAPWYAERYSFLWYCGKTQTILSGSALCWKYVGMNKENVFVSSLVQPFSPTPSFSISRVKWCNLSLYVLLLIKLKMETPCSALLNLFLSQSSLRPRSCVVLSREQTA